MQGSAVKDSLGWHQPLSVLCGMTWRQQSWRKAPGETVPATQRNATQRRCFGKIWDRKTRWRRHVTSFFLGVDSQHLLSPVLMDHESHVLKSIFASFPSMIVMTFSMYGPHFWPQILRTGCWWNHQSNGLKNPSIWDVFFFQHEGATNRFFKNPLVSQDLTGFFPVYFGCVGSWKSEVGKWVTTLRLCHSWGSKEGVTGAGAGGGSLIFPKVNPNLPQTESLGFPRNTPSPWTPRDP